VLAEATYWFLSLVPVLVGVGILGVLLRRMGRRVGGFAGVVLLCSASSAWAVEAPAGWPRRILVEVHSTDTSLAYDGLIWCSWSSSLGLYEGYADILNSSDWRRFRIEQNSGNNNLMERLIQCREKICPNLVFVQLQLGVSQLQLGQEGIPP